MFTARVIRECRLAERLGIGVLTGVPRARDTCCRETAAESTGHVAGHRLQIAGTSRTIVRRRGPAAVKTIDAISELASLGAGRGVTVGTTREDDQSEKVPDKNASPKKVEEAFHEYTLNLMMY